MNNWDVSESASRLHREALVCDMTLPWGPGFENREITLPRFSASGFDFVSLSVGHDAWGLSATLHHIGAVRKEIEAEPDQYTFVQTVSEIRRAKAKGKLALGFHFQGIEALDGDPNLVSVYCTLGVRQMLLAYNQKNKACDGCHERTDCGLSRFGIGIIQEMDRVGMLLDLTHTGNVSTLEAMEITENPVVFSHSNPKKIYDHPRNITDEQIKKCAEKDGVVGIVGLGPILPAREASVENFVRCITYVAELVGPRHVGVGLDFVYYEEQMFRKFKANPDRYVNADYPATRDQWRFMPPEKLPQVTETLLARGFSEDEIVGILGENYLRVAGQVWK